MRKSIAPQVLAFLIALAAFSPLEAQWVRSGLYNQRITSLAVVGPSLFAGTTDNVYAPKYSEGVLRSNDNGVTWEKCNNGLTDSNIVTLYSNNEQLFAATATAGVFRSVNRGKSWEWLKGLKTSKVNAFIAMNELLFAATAEHGVFVSSDMGDTWSSASEGLQDMDIHSLTVDGSLLFANATASPGRVYRSEDRGAHWSGLREAVFDITALNGQLFTAMYHTDEDGVLSSFDDGKTWTKVLGGGCGVFCMVVTAGQTLFAGHTQYGMFRSSDLGVSWLHDDGPIYQFSSVAALDTFFFVGTPEGVWRESYKSAFPSIAQSAVRSEQARASQLIVSPNPTTGVITIAGVQASKVTLTNLLGQIVAESARNNSSNLSLDLSKLPSGSYFARVATPDGVVVRRVVRE